MSRAEENITEPQFGRSIDLVRHMQYFLALAEHLHFGRAAEALGMSQPPLSQGIQRLEARLGARLFDRGGPVRLTNDGDDLVPKARALLAAADEITSPPQGRAAMRLGVAPQVPAPRTTQLIRTLRAVDAAPPPTVTAGSVELVRRVAGGRLDAALVVHPVVHDGVDADPSIIRLPMWAVVPDSHPFASSGQVELAELADLPLAVPARSENPAAHDLARDLAAAAGVAVVSGPGGDDRGALLAAASGRYAALTADPNLAAPGCARVELAGDPLPLRLRFVWTRDTRRAPRPDLRAALIAALEG